MTGKQINFNAGLKQEAALKITDADLQGLSPEEMKILMTYGPGVSTVIPSKLQPIVQKIGLYANQQTCAFIREFMVRDAVKNSVQASQAQDASLVAGRVTVYSETKAVVTSSDKKEEILYSRVPLSPEYFPSGRTAPWKGSDILACIVGSLTKWQGENVVLAMDLNKIQEKKFTSVREANSFSDILGDLGRWIKDVAKRTGLQGCKGRHWVFQVMQYLQSMEMERYLNLSTDIITRFTSVVIDTMPEVVDHMGVITQKFSWILDDQYLNYVGASVATDKYRQTLFFKKPLPKDHKIGNRTTGTTMIEAYSAIVDGVQFRGGYGSPLGSLVLSVDSWGLPSEMVWELETILTVLLGIEGNVFVDGLTFQMALFVEASWKHYRHERITFRTPEERRLTPITESSNFRVGHYSDDTYVFVDLSSIRTDIKKNVGMNMTVYDPAAVVRNTWGRFSHFRDELMKNKKCGYYFIGKLIPPDDWNGIVHVIRSPYDALCCIATVPEIRLMGSVTGEEFDLVFKVAKSLTAPQFYEAIALSANGANGLFLGPMACPNYSKANLVRPLAAKVQTFKVVMVGLEGEEAMVVYQEIRQDVRVQRADSPQVTDNPPVARVEQAPPDQPRRGVLVETEEM